MQGQSRSVDYISQFSFSKISQILFRSKKTLFNLFNFGKGIERVLFPNAPKYHVRFMRKQVSWGCSGRGSKVPKEYLSETF